MDIANHFSLLEMIEHPAFCVRDGIIISANKAASHRLFEVGKDIMDFLPADGAAYATFTGGCLHLNVTTADVTCRASVNRVEDFDLFVLDTEDTKLEAFALAAIQLKAPICTMVNIMEELIASDQEFTAQRGILRQQVYQINRIVNNMADAHWLQTDSKAHMEATEFSGLFREIMDKMDVMLSSAGYRLEFQNLSEPVVGLANRELLLRAISNILSNAVKFSHVGSLIRVTLTKKGDYLYLTTTNPGDSQEARGNVFARYARPAVIEDSRHGLGLGMEIVHSVAIDHGGTVLVDTPEGGGTRVTMSIVIQQGADNILRSPIILPGSQYTAGLDVGLVEFSDVLPPKAFQNIP